MEIPPDYTESGKKREQPNDLVSDVRMTKAVRMEPGRVRVGKFYWRKGKNGLPKHTGSELIVIHSKETDKWGPLSPFHFRVTVGDKHGLIHENVWQFAKVYPRVYAQNQSRNGWQWPAEQHLEPGTRITNEAYSKWREAGMAHPKAVRYPNGFKGRTECVYALWEGEQLGYVESRKKIYCRLYRDHIYDHPKFQALQAKLAAGQDLLIAEVDGPPFTPTYPPYDRLSRDNRCLLIDEPTIRLLINDPKYPFGHGYVIAALLLGGATWLE